MGAVLSKPKKPDTSKQEALLAEQEARIKQQEQDTAQRDAAAQKARRARTSARGSLLTGSETGVTDKRTTLG